MLDFDTKDFDRVLKKYLAQNSKENAELLNKKGAQFAAVAISRTGTAGATKTGNKTVKQGARYIYRELHQPRNDGNDPKYARWKNLGEAIIQQAYFKQNGRYLKDSQLKAQFNRLVRARTEKVGFLKSGWFPGLIKLNRQAARNKWISKDFVDKFINQTRRKAASTGFYEQGKDKGGAILATPQKQVVTIFNSVKVGKGLISKAAISALEYVRQDMLAYLARKKKESMQKFRS